MKITIRGIQLSARILFFASVLSIGMGQGGCETTTHDLNAISYGMMAQDSKYKPEQRRAFGAFSQYSSVQARRSHEREVADRMRSEINVNVHESQPQPTPRTQDPKPQHTSSASGAHMLVCNYYRDFNGNGKRELDEHVGVKSAFRRSETIYIALWGLTGRKGESLIFEVLDSKGEWVKGGEMKVLHDDQSTGMPVAPGELEAGDYLCSFRVGKEHLGRIQFSVQP